MSKVFIIALLCISCGSGVGSTPNITPGPILEPPIEGLTVIDEDRPYLSTTGALSSGDYKGMLFYRGATHHNGDDGDIFMKYGQYSYQLTQNNVDDRGGAVGYIGDKPAIVSFQHGLAPNTVSVGLITWVYPGQIVEQDQPGDVGNRGNCYGDIYDVDGVYKIACYDHAVGSATTYKEFLLTWDGEKWGNKEIILQGIIGELSLEYLGHGDWLGVGRGSDSKLYKITKTAGSIWKMEPIFNAFNAPPRLITYNGQRYLLYADRGDMTLKYSRWAVDFFSASHAFYHSSSDSTSDFGYPIFDGTRIWFYDQTEAGTELKWIPIGDVL